MHVTLLPLRPFTVHDLRCTIVPQVGRRLMLIYCSSSRRQVDPAARRAEARRCAGIVTC